MTTCVPQVQEGPGAPWRLLRLVLLVGDAEVDSLAARRRARATVAARLKAQHELDQLPTQPLLAMHTPLHHACAQLALQQLHAQARDIASHAMAIHQPRTCAARAPAYAA